MPITSDDDEQLQPEASEQQQQEAGEVTAASQQEQQQSRKRGKPRPTHFMALQVSHCPQVRVMLSSTATVVSQASGCLHHEPHTTLLDLVGSDSQSVRVFADWCISSHSQIQPQPGKQAKGRWLTA